MLMETLRGLPEQIEADFGDSIVARDEALAVLGASPGLGPPDLCWLQKCPKKTGLFGSSGEAQGYYHFVLGRDVSSSAAVAAYFALLNSKVEHRTMLQGLWMSPEYVIERGFYCCYEPISRMDMRCELCVPGGVAVGAVDATGKLHDVTPQLWQQAQVSAFVRAMLYDPEMRLNGGSVIAYDPCASAASEGSLLCSVLDLYSKGVLPGGLQDISEDMGYGVSADHMDLVLAALWQHFRRRQRWEAAADFFQELMQVYSPAALLLCAAQRAQGLAHGSGAVTLSELLARPAPGPTPHPSHFLVPATMVGLGHELLEQGDSEAAASLARRALAVSPRCRPAWLLLAKCFVVEGHFAAALVALNVVPTPPLPAAEVELLHVVPPPTPKDITKPQVHLYDGELEAARYCALEEASLDGSRLLAYLPGSILVNKEPLGTAFQSGICPNRITRSVLTAVYDLLQDIVKEVTWDRFLEVRSRVFLMQHEVAQSPAHNHSSSLSKKNSVSSEITPAGHPHESPRQELAALQAAQQAALLRKLEQLGLSADSPHSSAHAELHAPVSTTSPIRTSVGGGTGRSTPAASAGTGLAVFAGAGSTGPTPPASRGRLSSAGGSHRAGGTDPQSYYATRLQEELSKPHAGPSSSSKPGSSGGGGSAPGSSSGGGGPLPYSQLSVKVVPDQQQQQLPQQPQQQPHQQQQQRQVSSPASHVASPGSSASSTAAASAIGLRAPETPGAGQRSMAGRVLLLGKKTAAHTASSSRPPSARSVAPVGCGVPRSLAPNEVEDLSKYATASKVTSLRVPAAPGVMPELWNKVFGGGSNSNGTESATPPAAAPAAAGVRLSHKDTSSADSDDGLSAAAAGLPRIRTRPLAEQAEDECWLDADVAQVEATAQDAFPAARQYRPNVRSFLQTQGCSCADKGHNSQHSSMGGSCSSSKWRLGFLTVRSNSSSSSSRRKGCTVCGSNANNSSRQQQQPLGEGLDRTLSLLKRTTSNASTGAGLSGSISLPRSGSVRQGASVNSAAGLHSGGGLHSAGSGNLSTRGSRRMSLVGEAANRSLEADREGLTKGWVHDDASAQSGWGGVDGVGSPGAGGRRLCVRWLDELIVALWHDLQAHMEWKVVDQQLRDTRGGTAAELVCGLAPSADAASPTSATSAATTPSTAMPGVNNGGAFEPPVLTCADWMRRGALAERLGHTFDAQSAYRACVKLSFNLTSYLAFMRLEAEAESIGNTALCASQILNWHQKRAGQPGQGEQAGGSGSSSASTAAAAGSGGLVMMGVPPADVMWAMGMVAHSRGVEEVRRGMADVPPAAQAMLMAVLDEWQRWRQVQVQPALAARQLRQ